MFMFPLKNLARKGLNELLGVILWPVPLRLMCAAGMAALTTKHRVPVIGTAVDCT